jgi:hypothetical protein
VHPCSVKKTTMLFRVTRSVSRNAYNAGSSVEPPYELAWFDAGETPQCDRGDDLPEWLKLTLRMPFCKSDCNCVYTPFYDRTYVPDSTHYPKFPPKPFDTTSSDEEDVQESDNLHPLVEANAIDMSEEDRELQNVKITTTMQSSKTLGIRIMRLSKAKRVLVLSREDSLV